MDIYNAKLAEWPVPYESVFLDTSYGKVHVIVSGPTDAPPLLLIHASAVAGASIGGYIATNYALYAPERVKKLVLLGSMGYGGTSTTVLLMVLAQSFPLNWIQDKTLAWALGDAPHVKERFGQWFRLILSGTVPKPTPPASFTPEQLQQMQVPVLAFFGTKDKVIRDAGKASALAENIPDVRVELVESGHLIGAELPDIVNPVMPSSLSVIARYS